MAALIVRDDLLSLLSKSTQFPLTVLTAPAGFGKSTLLDQWQKANPQRFIVRVNLNENQTHIKQVCKAFLDQLRSQIEVIDAQIFNLFDDNVDITQDFIVGSIVQVLEAIEGPIYLVVDDFQYADGADSKELISAILDRIPSHVHFILASRTHPKLNLSKLKLNDALLLIDTNDLMLTIEQIQSLCLTVCGFELDEYHLTRLYELTEGWFVGVKIALLVVKDHGVRSIDDFNGGQPDLVEYFGSEVYESLSPSGQQFFVNTAIFDQFNVEVCDYVLGRNDSHLVLGDLIDQSVFIVEDKQKRNWFRYHSLLKEFLRKKLKSQYRDQELHTLHLKCVDGFVQQGEFEQAIYHAFLSENESRLLQVLLEACVHWMKVGGFVQIIKSLDQLDETELFEHRRLSIIYGYSLVFSRRFNQAHYFLDQLKSYYRGQENKTLFEDIAYLELSLKLLQRDIETIEKIQVEALLESAYSSDIRTFSLILAAYVDLQGGKLAEALNIAHKAKAILARKGHVFMESYADLIIALCDRYMGRGIDAVNYISNIYTRSHFDKGGLPWVSLTTAMVVVCYEQNQLKKARSLCEQLIPCLNHTCVTEVISTVYQSYSRLLFIDGDTRKAARVLDQLDRILILGQYERFTSQTLFESMRQAYICGDGVKTRQLLELHKLDDSLVKEIEVNGRFNEAAERKLLAWSYAMGLSGQYEIAQKALAKLTVTLNQLGLVSRVVIARSNAIVLEFNKGQKRSAVAQLKQLISEQGFTRFSRNTFDESPGLQAVFDYAEEVSEFVSPNLFKSVYSDLFNGDGGQPSLFPIMSLTEKELQVYNLLSEGLSNAEISKETGVALSTTKWHLKNIYQKLGVANRAEAIVKKQLVKEP